MSLTNFRSMFIFASCVVGTRNLSALRAASKEPAIPSDLLLLMGKQERHRAAHPIYHCV